MKFIYTEHAEEGLIERKIRKYFVEDVVFNSDKVVESVKGRKIAQKEINDKLLRVVYKKTNKLYIVITAYYIKIRVY